MLERDYGGQRSRYPEEGRSEVRELKQCPRCQIPLAADQTETALWYACMYSPRVQFGQAAASSETKCQGMLARADHID